MDSIYHLAIRSEWEEAVATGEYERSTLGLGLDDVGFIHCSSAHQVQPVADRFYTGRADVVLVTIDPARVPSEIIVENLEGGTEGFPHIYGPLPVAAAVRVDPVGLADDGRLLLDDLVS